MTPPALDDFAVFSDSRDELRTVRRRIARYLAGLRLTLHEKRTRTWRSSDGAEFLGFRVFPDYRLVRKSSAVKFGRRLRMLTAECSRAGNSAIHSSLQSWFGHTRYAASWRLNRIILARAGLLAREESPELDIGGDSYMLDS